MKDKTALKTKSIKSVLQKAKEQSADVHRYFDEIRKKICEAVIAQIILLDNKNYHDETTPSIEVEVEFKNANNTGNYSGILVFIHSPKRNRGMAAAHSKLHTNKPDQFSEVSILMDLTTKHCFKIESTDIQKFVSGWNKEFESTQIDISNVAKPKCSLGRKK